MRREPVSASRAFGGSARLGACGRGARVVGARGLPWECNRRRTAVGTIGPGNGRRTEGERPTDGRGTADGRKARRLDSCPPVGSPMRPRSGGGAWAALIAERSSSGRGDALPVHMSWQPPSGAASAPSGALAATRWRSRSRPRRPAPSSAVRRHRRRVAPRKPSLPTRTGVTDGPGAAGPGAGRAARRAPAGSASTGSVAATCAWSGAPRYSLKVSTYPLI